MDQRQAKDKKTDHGPLDARLRPDDGPNRAAKYYPNSADAQDLKEKSDTEQPHGAGGT